jgi:hypothetical protein
MLLLFWSNSSLEGRGKGKSSDECVEIDLLMMISISSHATSPKERMEGGGRKEEGRML